MNWLYFETCQKHMQYLYRYRTISPDFFPKFHCQGRDVHKHPVLHATEPEMAGCHNAWACKQGHPSDNNKLKKSKIKIGE